MMELKKDILMLPSIDWHRRLFDALIPLPDGTSYNAYLVRGTEKTALIDTADPAMGPEFIRRLSGIDKIDYIIANHAEQDHSGLIPEVMNKYPRALVVTSAKGGKMLTDHLAIPGDRIRVVADGETIPMGGKTLQFIYTPWVHWPETMATYLPEDRILFSCDFFGSHLATSQPLAADEKVVYEAAKRYYAEIMMPFRSIIANNLAKLAKIEIGMIAPSHGPVHQRPAFILDAYREWVTGAPHNLVVMPFISMHGSTGLMVSHLVNALMSKGVEVMPFDLAVTDIGKLAIALVDAATIVIGTPTVHLGPHPAVHYAAGLANALRPKARYASIIGSYGWNNRTVECIAALIPNLKLEIIAPVLCLGLPREADFAALAGLADAIARRHSALNSGQQRD